MSPSYKGGRPGITGSGLLSDPTTPDQVTSTVLQARPVGTDPAVDVLLIGSLIWSAHDQSSNVLALVTDEDVESPALAVLLSVIRSLTLAGRPAGPQLVLAELQRRGAATGLIAGYLRDAVVSGASPPAVGAYAAAVVAASLRRRIATAGRAMIEMAGTATEDDLTPFISKTVDSITDCAGRLVVLRGGDTHGIS